MRSTPSRRVVRAVASCRPNVLCATLLLALPGAAAAVDVDYTLGASLLRSDNIQLRSFDPIQDTVLLPNLSFEARQSSSTVQMTAQGNLAYAHYFGGTFDDELRGELQGQLNWVIAPQRMDFVVKDSLNRQPISVLTGFNPNNQQQVNVFIAGPTFHARFGETSRGQLDLRYGNSYAQENKGFNSDRYNAAARVLRDLSATSTITANAEATRAQFNDPNANFNRYDAYIGYLLNLNSIDVSADAGYSQLDLAGTQGSESEPMARAHVSWRPAPRSQFDAQLSYQFTDAAQDMLTNTGELESSIIGEFGTGDVLVGPRVFRQRQLDVGYRYKNERLTLHVEPFYRRAHYLAEVGGDESLRGGTFTVDYKLKPQLTLSFLLYRSIRKFDDLDRRDQDTAAYLGLIDQVTRHWSWRVDYQHRGRGSSEPGASYGENAIVFSINYRR